MSFDFDTIEVGHDVSTAMSTVNFIFNNLCLSNGILSTKFKYLPVVIFFRNSQKELVVPTPAL